MALTTNCCLNLSPPTSNSSLPSSSSSPITKPSTQVAWNDKWRRQCVVGLACVIVGLEMGDLTGNSTENLAVAHDVQLVAQSRQQQKGRRWSDNRTCPPWRLNSLETIVPENLPRPSARRRWEAVGDNSYNDKKAPAVKATVKYSSNGCFSM